MGPESSGWIGGEYTPRRVRFTGAQWAIQKPIGLAGRPITSRGVHSADGVLATAYAGAPGLAGSSAIVIHSHRRGPVMILWPRCLRREFSHKCRNCGYL